MAQIENVIVDNGILKHTIQWMYSPKEIVTLANRALTFVSQDIVSEINSKNLTVLITTKSDYSDYITKTILDADNELLFRFNNIT